MQVEPESYSHKNEGCATVARKSRSPRSLILLVFVRREPHDMLASLPSNFLNRPCIIFILLSPDCMPSPPRSCGLSDFFLRLLAGVPGFISEQKTTHEKCIFAIVHADGLLRNRRLTLAQMLLKINCVYCMIVVVVAAAVSLSVVSLSVVSRLMGRVVPVVVLRWVMVLVSTSYEKYPDFKCQMDRKPHSPPKYFSSSLALAVVS